VVERRPIDDVSPTQVGRSLQGLHGVQCAALDGSCLLTCAVSVVAMTENSTSVTSRARDHPGFKSMSHGCCTPERGHVVPEPQQWRARTNARRDSWCAVLAYPCCYVTNRVHS